MRNVDIPSHSFITFSYLMSIFWFSAIVISIPVIVCLVNNSPDSPHGDEPIPITHHPDNINSHSLSLNKPQIEQNHLQIPTKTSFNSKNLNSSSLILQSQSPPNLHSHIHPQEYHDPFLVLHHAYLDTTPLKKSWRAVISTRYLFFSLFLVLFQFVPFI